MKFIFFIICPFFLVFSQETNETKENDNKPSVVKGVIKDDTSGELLSNVHIVNLNAVKGAISDAKGQFEIQISLNDTIHFSIIGYQSLKVRVTNDWIKNKNTTIKLTSKAEALEEVVVNAYKLTGYLEVDVKNIPISENYRYSIQGLSYGYEAGDKSPRAVNKVLQSIFNPADALYNFFGKKPRELNKLKEAKKDDNIRLLLESKFDRETLAVLLEIDKNDIPEILERCNYSETFIKTANDLQILDAINDCYEEYKVLNKRKKS